MTTMALVSLTLQLHDIQFFKQGFLLFGRDKLGDSVSVHLTNDVRTYFYLRSRGDRSNGDLQHLQKELNDALRKQLIWESHRERCSAMQCTCENKVFVDNQC